MTLQPLLDQRGRALEPTPGVLGAKVVELQIASRSAGNEATILVGDDLLHRLSDPAFDGGVIRAARLRLQLRGERRLRDVSLRVPDEMAWDWRRHNADIRGFIEERGFLVVPLGGVSWQAA